MSETEGEGGVLPVPPSSVGIRPESEPPVTVVSDTDGGGSFSPSSEEGESPGVNKQPGEEEDVDIRVEDEASSSSSSSEEGEQGIEVEDLEETEEEEGMEPRERVNSVSSLGSSDLELEARLNSLDLDSPVDYAALFSGTPPPLDFGNATSEEVKVIYTKLIESLKACGNKLTPRERADKILLDNIRKGGALMTSIAESCSSGTSKPLVASPSDLLIAVEHTKLCAEHLKHRAQDLGEGDTVFRMDQFIAELKRVHVDQKGQYSPVSAVATLSTEFMELAGFLEMPQFLLGAVPRPEGIPNPHAEEEASPKLKVQRRRTRGDAEGEATQAEILNESGADLEDEGGAQAEAKDVLKGLKEKGGQSRGLLEVAAEGDNVSVNDVVGRLVGTSFLVRDGRAALGTVNKNSEAGAVGDAANLTLKAAKPLKGTGEGDEGTPERQHAIVSLSAKRIREMLASGTLPDFMSGGQQDD